MVPKRPVIFVFDVTYLRNPVLDEAHRRVTTCPVTGQVVTTPGASCNVHDRALNVLYTCIISIQGYYGTFRGDFSIFKTFILTHK